MECGGEFCTEDQECEELQCVSPEPVCDPPCDAGLYCDEVNDVGPQCMEPCEKCDHCQEYECVHFCEGTPEQEDICGNCFL